MKIKNKWFLTLGILLIVVFVLAGCNTPWGNEKGNDSSDVVGTSWKGNIGGEFTEIIRFTSAYFQASRSDGATVSGRYVQSGNAITFETNSGVYIDTGYVAGNTLSAFGITYIKQ
jgi:predicted small secreted protein